MHYVCYNVLQRVAVCCRVTRVLQSRALCCSVSNLNESRHLRQAKGTGGSFKITNKRDEAIQGKLCIHFHFHFDISKMISTNKRHEVVKGTFYFSLFFSSIFMCIYLKYENQK